VSDFVSWIDFAPTFLAAGVDKHTQHAGRSFADILTASQEGWVDASRDHAFMGKERHDVGREGDLGYPVRCLRTKDYLYVRNYEPDRWPAGNPETGFTNVDSSPTKSLILEQHDSGDDRYYDLSFGKRPAEELFDMREDTACMHNLADDAEHAEVKEQLKSARERALIEQGDPRVFGKGEVFDQYAYVGNATHSWKRYVEGGWERQGY